MGASMRRAAMPAWSLLVLGVLFVGPVVMFESVFGGGQGAIAAGVGVRKFRKKKADGGDAA